LSLALICLREARGWTQQELGTAAGLGKNSIYEYERGQRRKLRHAQLEEFAALMGFGPKDVTLALLFVANVGLEETALVLSPVDPSPQELHDLRQMAARAGLAESIHVYDLLVGLARVRLLDEARQEALHQWETLERLPPSRQLKWVVESSVAHSWALAELLCEKSVMAAADKASRALHLATLALRLVEVAPASDTGWKAQLEGYCRAFVANAQRVGGNLPLASESIALAWRRWNAGEKAGAYVPLPRWRLFDLEASLRRDQRQFAEAIQLLDRALSEAPAAAAVHILLNQQSTFEQAGDLAASRKVLEEIEPLLAADGDPRRRWIFQLNRLVVLCRLGHFDAAEAGLPTVRQLTIALGNELDLTRVLWLTGRVHAGLGRPSTARDAFDQARRDFIVCDNGYETALLTLEIVILDLSEGCIAEATAGAEKCIEIFKSQRVPRETLAALALFSHAVREGTARTDVARRLLDDLERARALPRPAVEEAF
jgi:transcriptional regulator with XRE-family HTH domain